MTWDIRFKNRISEMLVIALFTALIGQIHFYPFGTDFRLTLGVVVFTFLILYFKVPIMATATLSALFVLSLRTGLDHLSGAYPIGDSITRHLPAVFFYLCYGVIIEQMDLRSYIEKPVYFIVIVSTSDIFSNFFELMVRNNLRSYPLESVLSTIIMAALIRSFLVLILFWGIRYYNLLIVKEIHQKRYQELLLLTARLNSEVLFLKKSTQDIEAVMVKSYGIYSHSKEIAAGRLDTLKSITEDSLALAIDIHEIKKDYLRIVHSINKIIPDEKLSPSMRISDILRTIEDIFSGFSESMDIPLRFQNVIKRDISITRYYEVISILNNLIHNALEAAKGNSDPWIRIDVASDDESLMIRVEDNGKGISPSDYELIFEPGFTTKMNLETGELPTGLGLTHVRILTELLQGTIEVDPQTQRGAAFVLKLPLNALTE